MFGSAKSEFYSTFGVPRVITKSFYKLRPEAVIEKRITCKSLHNILASHLLPHMYLGEVLQQDNAPAHKSAETSTWFLENGVDVLENWPPNSPDLNIIENLWSILKGRVAKRHPKTLEDLETFALEEFYAIPDEYVQKLSSR